MAADDATGLAVGVALGDLDRDLDEERVDEPEEEVGSEEENSVHEERDVDEDELDDAVEEERDEAVLVVPVVVPVATELPEVTRNRVVVGFRLPSDSPLLMGRAFTRGICDLWRIASESCSL